MVPRAPISSLCVICVVYSSSTRFFFSCLHFLRAYPRHSVIESLSITEKPKKEKKKKERAFLLVTFLCLYYIFDV